MGLLCIKGNREECSPHVLSIKGKVSVTCSTNVSARRATQEVVFLYYLYIIGASIYSSIIR